MPAGSCAALGSQASRNDRHNENEESGRVNSLTASAEAHSFVKLRAGSGPLLDRIDIHVDVPRVNYEKLSVTRQGEPSHAVRERVAAARAVQTRRFKGTRLRTNADMGPPRCASSASWMGLGSD